MTEVVHNMSHSKSTFLAAMALMLFGVSACQDKGISSDATPAAATATGETGIAAQPVPSPATTSPGKPTAPVDISYEIIGTAIVGTPVSINIVVTSEFGPVDVEYSIVDSSALTFQSGQVERRQVLDPSSGDVQQLTVIPLREGRVYVNVSAEIPSAQGLNIRSIAIPIQVGSAADMSVVNGELVDGPGGEKVNSMPAQESN